MNNRGFIPLMVSLIVVVIVVVMFLDHLRVRAGQPSRPAISDQQSAGSQTETNGALSQAALPVPGEVTR